MLERILVAQPSMREAISTLRGYPFDVPEPLLLLTVAIARDVLARHQQGRITDDDLEAWADALEMRDDVELDPLHDDILKECLFELSAPVMSGKPMAALAADWRARLANVPAD